MNPVPADDVGAELAVTRPAFPELADWLDGSRVPIEVAYGLDDERLVAIAAEIVRQVRVTDAISLAVGAALHKRRGDYPRGKWLPYVAGVAASIGTKTGTLGDWMRDAERFYGLELPKAANPTRRRPEETPVGRSIEPPVSPADAPPTARNAHEPPLPPARPLLELAQHLAPDFNPRPREDRPAPAPTTTRVPCPTCAGAGTVERRRNALPPPSSCPPHPKAGRKQLGYMTVCGACSSAVKPGE